MGVSNFIFGGMCGYSGGKERRARKKPPIKPPHSQPLHPHIYIRRVWKGTLTSIQLDIIRDHQHNLPLEDVVVRQPAADAGDVLVALHLLQLAGEHPSCGRGRHGVCRLVSVLYLCSVLDMR